MITAIDRFIWAVHQKVVDLSQQKPQWWACRLWDLMVPVWLLRSWFANDGAIYLFFLVLDIYVLFSMWNLTHTAPIWDAFQKLARLDRHVALFRKVGLAALVFLALVAPTFLGLLGNALLLSVFYFALCGDPKPREPRAVPQT